MVGSPFIHSSIVDEWETTNLTPPAHRDKTAMNGAQHSILPYHRGGQTNDRATCRRKLEKAGFQLVQLRYYNFVGYFAWWVSFCLLKKRSFDVAAVRFFDRAIFPVVHGLESRVCQPPFGQSLLAVAIPRGSPSSRIVD
jgi:hypothetical protein